MRARILVMQRKGAYPGQYAPEVLAIVDEHTLEDNPTWWDEEKQRQHDLVGEDAQAFAEVDLVLNDAAIERALYPQIVVEYPQVVEERS